MGSGSHPDLYPYLGLGVNSQMAGGYNGIETVNGIDSNLMAGYSFNYLYGSNADYGIDELDVGDGIALMESQDENIRAVSYDSGLFRTIAASAFFGALADGIGINTKTNMMVEYLDFLIGSQEPNIWTSQTEIDFGVQFAGFSSTEQLSIINAGADTLIIQNIELESEEFSYEGLTCFDLEPHEQVILEVIFESSETGSFTGELQINSNDPDTPELTVALMAECFQPPIIQCDPIFFEVTITCGQTIDEVMTITNTGGYELHYSIVIQEPFREVTWLEIDQNNGILEPGENDIITLTFEAGLLEEGTYLAELVINHTDPFNDDIVVPVTMNISSVNAGYGTTPVLTQLKGNYPNPFNPTTTISFSTTGNSEANTEIIIYNLKGQKIKTLVNKRLPAGNHSVIWNSKDENSKSVTSGIYFYKMKTYNYTSIKKMILLK